MHWMIAALLTALLAAPAAAQSAPNKLTPDEVREGWISLFDGKTTHGWQPTAGSDAKWVVRDGALEMTGTKGGLHTTSEFDDFDLSFEVWVDAPTAAPAFGVLRGTVAHDPDAVAFGSGYIGPAPPANTWIKAKVHKVGRLATYQWGGAGGYHLSGRALRSTILLTCAGKSIRFRNIKLRLLPSSRLEQEPGRRETAHCSDLRQSKIENRKSKINISASTDTRPAGARRASSAGTSRRP